MLLRIKWIASDARGSAAASRSPIAPGRFLDPFTGNALLLATAVLACAHSALCLRSNRRFVGRVVAVCHRIRSAFECVEAFRGVELPDDSAAGYAGIGSLDLVQDNVSLTILWSLTALVMLAVGFLAKSTQIRYVALALFAMTILKTLIVDMANMQSILCVLRTAADAGDRAVRRELFTITRRRPETASPRRRGDRHGLHHHLSSRVPPFVSSTTARWRRSFTSRSWC